LGSVHSGAADVLPYVEADLKKTALRVIDKAKALCAQVQSNPLARLESIFFFLKKQQ
jgi:hypothetical protein